MEPIYTARRRTPGDKRPLTSELQKNNIIYMLYVTNNNEYNAITL